MDYCILFLLLATSAVCVNGRRKARLLDEKRDPETEACTAASQPHKLTNPTGHFGSPYRPSLYPSNQFCQWSIEYIDPQTDIATDRVMLMFSYLNTEEGFDGVQVVDGADGSGNLWAIYSGDYTQALPPAIFSTLPGLLVSFTSDPTVNDWGFDAAYTTDQACFEGEHAMLTGSGSFTSPFYPGPMYGGMGCEWMIGDNTTVTGEVTFDYFNVGTVTEGYHCAGAHLWYLDSTGKNAYLCGAIIPDPVTFTGATDFHFVTPTGYVPADAEGFSARYTTTTI